jgi:hypothetical protein
MKNIQNQIINQQEKLQCLRVYKETNSELKDELR